MIKELICEREELEKGAWPHQDLITCLLNIRGETNEAVISDKEIIHNVLLIMTALPGAGSG